MVERAAFAMSVNEAWALLAVVATIALISVWCLGKPNVEPLER
jgi:4-hydroxybenzoate polyprenyltransferase